MRSGQMRSEDGKLLGCVVCKQMVVRWAMFGPEGQPMTLGTPVHDADGVPRSAELALQDAEDAWFAGMREALQPPGRKRPSDAAGPGA